MCLLLSYKTKTVDECSGQRLLLQGYLTILEAMSQTYISLSTPNLYFTALYAETITQGIYCVLFVLCVLKLVYVQLRYSSRLIVDKSVVVTSANRAKS